MDEGMKELVAGLNLKAGHEAISLSAFQNSALYFAAGISLLCNDCWNKSYDLSLKLYSSYAEVEFCNGHFDEVGRVTKIILQKAKSLQDRVRAYSTLIKTLGAQKQSRNAIEISLSVLGDLEEPVQYTSREDLVKTLHIFTKMDNSQFLRLKKMDDSTKGVVMKLLHTLSFHCFFSESKYLPFALNRMLELTLSHGVCKESCSAFATISFMLCGLHGDQTGSSRAGELALLLLDISHAKEYESNVRNFVSTTQSWTDPLRLTIKRKFSSYEIGMQTGAIDDAMYSAAGCCYYQFFCGIELPILEKDCRRFIKQMSEYKQTLAKDRVTIFLQVALNLMGKSNNPLELTGEAMIQSQFIEECPKQMKCGFYILSSWLAYLFGEYKLASLAVSNRMEAEKTTHKKLEWVGFTLFYDCLIYLASARRKQNSLTSDISGKSKMSGFYPTALMKKLVDYTQCNNQHRLLLVEAEVAYSKGEYNVAIEKYDSAIVAAEVVGILHEQAICNERAGDFFLAHGNIKRATSHYGHAIDLYHRWGAQAKVDHLCKQIPL
eukprot:15366088-Ditylum_brightwellii.AAC.1